MTDLHGSYRNTAVLSLIRQVVWFGVKAGFFTSIGFSMSILVFFIVVGFLYGHIEQTEEAFFVFIFAYVGNFVGLFLLKFVPFSLVLGVLTSLVTGFFYNKFQDSLINLHRSHLFCCVISLVVVLPVVTMILALLRYRTGVGYGGNLFLLIYPLVSILSLWGGLFLGKWYYEDFQNDKEQL